MNRTYDVAVLVGSLRKGSFNRMTANTLLQLAPESLHLEIVEIGALPLFNQDIEQNPPREWADFKQRIRAADAALFVTPEYNRSVPGVLKNAIDIASRPYGDSAWQSKPAAVISVSPSAIGGFGANHHLRQSMVFLDMPLMQQPEAYVGGAAKLFDDNGQLINDSTREFLQNFIDTFAAWVERHAPGGGQPQRAGSQAQPLRR